MQSPGSHPAQLTAILNPSRSSQNLRQLHPKPAAPAGPAASDVDIDSLNEDDSDADTAAAKTTATTTSTATPPRKRSKVSRACDACRRKKVKCNATFHADSKDILKKCTNCVKNDESCTFTRVPLKRGPSKGFKNNNHNQGSSSQGQSQPPTQQKRARGTSDKTHSPSPHSSVSVPNATLPPLTSIPQTQTQTQQEIFWKVPTTMPTFNTSSFPSSHSQSHSRKGSVDSTHSSLSSTSTMSSNARQLMMTASHSMTKSVSDSEDESILSSNRFPRKSFHAPPIPIAPQARSPRVSFTSDRDRSSISSIISASESASASAASASTSAAGSPGHDRFEPLAFTILDSYYSTLYIEYPLLPHPDIIKNSLLILNQTHEFDNVVELFTKSLNTIPLTNLSTDHQININFKDICQSFETLVSWFLSKSIIYSSIEAKTILTSTLILLNYGIVLSGYDYSLGFGISFSYLKDWLIFKEGYGSPSFANLIQLVILDNLHTLYFGVPRSSTICFAIDSTFIDTYLKETKFLDSVELEWLSLGLNLVVLNNNLQQLDTLDKLNSIEVTGTNHKFMMIIKLYYDLFVYFRNINVSDFKSNNNNNNNDYLTSYIYNIELDIIKLCKKITNIIDEQLDDLEIMNANVLIPLILTKCLHISINVEIILRSILHLNLILQPLNLKKLSSLSHLNNNNNTTVQDSNDRSILGGNRSRSSSTNSSIDTFRTLSPNSPSLMNLNQTQSLNSCNERINKLIENIQSNGGRCTQFRQIHAHCYELLNKLHKNHIDSRLEITVPRTINSGGIEFGITLQSWVRLVNTYFTDEITKEGINGWSYL